MRHWNRFQTKEQIGLFWGKAGLSVCHLLREKRGDIRVQHQQHFPFSGDTDFETALLSAKSAFPLSSTPVIVGLPHPIFLSQFVSVSALLKPKDIRRYINAKISDWLACSEALCWQHERLPPLSNESDRRFLRIVAARFSPLQQAREQLAAHSVDLRSFASVSCAVQSALRFAQADKGGIFFRQDQHDYLGFWQGGNWQGEIVLPAQAPVPIFSHAWLAHFSAQTPGFVADDLMPLSAMNIAVRNVLVDPIAFGLALWGWT